jgi:hypothetical protein
MASFGYSQFPEWQHADRPRKGRDTLIIALVATAIGITAGGSTVAFLMFSPVTGQNPSATISAEASSGLNVGQRTEEQQPSLGTPKFESANDQSQTFDRTASKSSQMKPPADSQPSSTAQPSVNPSSLSWPDDATRPEATMRAEPENPPTANAAVAYCMQRYRSYDPASRTFLGNDGRRHPCPRETN